MKELERSRIEKENKLENLVLQHGSIDRHTNFLPEKQMPVPKNMQRNKKDSKNKEQ